MISFRAIALTCLALLCMVPACRRKSTEVKPKSEINAWPTLSADEAGLDSNNLKAFSDSIVGNGVVVRHDSLAYSWGRPHVPYDVASAEKPVMVHLVFKAVEKGLIANIDDPVVKWEPGLAKLNAPLDHKDKRITWRHLMNQTSGYGLIEEPGTTFGYNDFQTQMFWDVLFEKVFKVTPEDAAEKVLRPQLFDLIGALDKPSYRLRPPPQPTSRLVVSASDFARVGLVYLHGGRWKGQPIIDEKWVKLALTSPLPLSVPRTSGKDAEMLPGARSLGGGKNQEDNLGSYSFMWWLNKPDRTGKLLWPDLPTDAYAAAGNGGQKLLMVIPSLDLVVSWNSTNLERYEMWAGGRDQINAAIKRLLDAIKK